MESEFTTGPGVTDWLILVPTQMELNLILGHPLYGQPPWNTGQSELCGFGAIAATAHAAKYISELKPTKVMLIGLAGGYDDRFSPGTAVVFDNVACYGVGAGCGPLFQSAEQMGWKQWPSGDDRPPRNPELIECVHAIYNGERESDRKGNLLLTVTAVSANKTEAKQKQAWFPGAIAEDMEAYGIAMVCRLYEIPLHIIRGISNWAGDRDKQNWRIGQAIDAAVQLATKVLAGADYE